jgi:hypothetical protein
MIDVYGQSQSHMGLLGSSSASCCIKVIHTDMARLATIGGLVKILASDNTYSFYGMTAGHIFLNDDEIDEDMFDENEPRSEDSDRDESFLSDSEDVFELDLPSEEQNDNSIPTNFRDGEDIEQPMVSWSKVGRLFETSENTVEDGMNLDWALVTIDNPPLYYSMVGTDPIHKLGEDVGLIKLTTVAYDAGRDRDVLLSGGASGIKMATLSTTLSYLNLEPGRSLIGTYTVRLSDNTGMLTDSSNINLL